MTRSERAAVVVRNALVADSHTSDPGLTWDQLASYIAPIWPGSSIGTLRLRLGFAVRAVRLGDAANPGLPVINDPGDGYVYRLALDRADAGQWLRRTGRSAIRRAENLVTYADIATAAFGHVTPTGPPLWIAARAQLDAAHTTLILAHDASF